MTVLARSLLPALVFVCAAGATPGPSPAPPPGANPGRSATPRPAWELYRRHCQRCHGADGSGGAAGKRLSDLPDFTDRRWQEQRSDAQLLVSILDGKGAGMPAYRDKLDDEQAQSLVALVRSFAGVTAESPPNGAGADNFDRRFRQLQQELDDLQKQFRELSREKR
jgi:cytochrome c6